MKHTRTLAVLAFLAWLILPVGLAWGQADDKEKTVFEHVIPNIEGKSMVVVVVTYPPGGKSLAHHHARSAFIYAYVLSGAIRSQVDDEPAKVYQVGEGFYEMPDSHHRISENASDREPAALNTGYVHMLKPRNAANSTATSYETFVDHMLEKISVFPAGKMCHRAELD